MLPRDLAFPQMRLSSQEMAMMIDAVLDGTGGAGGQGLDLETYMQILETSQWY
jgi:hypothetical protein